MTKVFKGWWWTLLVVSVAPPALGFSLMGPVNEPFQTTTIGYKIGGDIGVPKNLAEEYRWTTPTNYYAFDATFLEYFGSNGVYAIDQAVAILNNSLTNLTDVNLDDFPLESRRSNYRANALHLFDLKSVALFMMLEELGVTDSIRWTWCLHSRFCPACPACTYTVIKRNFDPISFEPTSYVNSILYSYGIVEICSGPDPLADAVEFTVDPLASEFTPVSSLTGLFGDYGFYYTGLTRDDIAGVRYLLRTNNMNIEGTSSDSLFLQTNTTSQLLVPSNLTLLAAQALTNDAGALIALYPGLVITSTTNTFTNVWTTNLTAYFTNYPFDPLGTPPHVAFATSVSVSAQTLFQHTFQNLLTFQLVNGKWVAVPINQIPPPRPAFVTSLVTNIYTTNKPFAPVGTFITVTNVTTKTYLTNMVIGEFAVLASNLCDLGIIGVQLTNVVPFTNLLVTATNTTAGTNEQSFSQSLITYFTNHAFITLQVNCVTNFAALRQGMNHINFVKTSFDSLLERFYQPITNVYSLIQVTNSSLRKNWFQRVVIRPDLLFNASDLGTTSALRTDTAGNFRTNNELPALAGPGNIEPNMVFTFNKVGPILLNIFDPFFVNSGLTERTALTNFIWGSFGGSTNAPIVYPQGSSIADLENQVLFRIVATPPDGANGVPYSSQLIAGGQPPYSSSVAGTFPPGLAVNTDGSISGTPIAPGTFSFTVTVTDSTVPIPLTRSETVFITINP